ncbi:MAG: hypothetical protein JXR73_17350, partial [Candidatus Omnitrophica bacterium]|nr:hypothetical protein [Candidatus Omnitrophota bacterium]
DNPLIFIRLDSFEPWENDGWSGSVGIGVKNCFFLFVFEKRGAFKSFGKVAKWSKHIYPLDGNISNYINESV